MAWFGSTFSLNSTAYVDQSARAPSSVPPPMLLAPPTALLAPPTMLLTPPIMLLAPSTTLMATPTTVQGPTYGAACSAHKVAGHAHNTARPSYYTVGPRPLSCGEEGWPRLHNVPGSCCWRCKVTLKLGGVLRLDEVCEGLSTTEGRPDLPVQRLLRLRVRGQQRLQRQALRLVQAFLTARAEVQLQRRVRQRHTGLTL